MIWITYQHEKPICWYRNGCTKQINNYLEDLYVGIIVDVEKFNYYLGNLYAGIVNFKWLYGN
jgi:hypothetical protein